MKTSLLIVLTVSAIFICRIVNAGLVSVHFVIGPYQHPDGEHITLRVIASFDDPMDRISAVSGLTGQTEIKFSIVRGVFYNQPQFEGFPINDFPSTSIGGEPWDTYVTIGATDYPHNVQFTPGFMNVSNDPPKNSVIQGCNLEEDNGAWFFYGAPPTVGQYDSIPDNDTYDVVIAQFTVVSQADLNFMGNLHWSNAGGGSASTPFYLGNLSSYELADLNGDWNINTPDLLILLAAWGPTDYDTGPEFCPTPPDFNDDGVVDVFDLEFLLENWYIK